MTDTLHSLQAHPYVGGLATIVLTILGACVPKINLLFSLELPLWIMQWLQVGAWISAIITMLILVHGWYKKNYKK